LDQRALKQAVKESALVQRMVRTLIIPGVRGYFRYVPTNLGKKKLWGVVLMHYLGLEPPAWDFTAQTVFGSTIAANTRDNIPRNIFYFGVWEPNLTHWIRGRLKPGDTFIDVGANIGYFTLLAAKLVGASGKVVAVEAHPAIFAALENNLEINGFRNVRAVNCAAWDVEEIVTIYTQPEDLPGQTTVMPGWAEKYALQSQLRVPAAPLSAILKLEEFEAARLIKIDVEGAEWHAIRGMQPLMASCRDDLEIMIELNSKMLAADNKTPQDALDLFAGYGFRAYQIENDYLQERYLYREAPLAPRRVERIVKEQADVIFSRVDAEAL
jgi:FkbM family methyltransferase